LGAEALPDARRGDIERGLGGLTALQNMGVGVIRDAGVRLETAGETMKEIREQAKSAAKEAKRKAEDAAKDLEGILGGSQTKEGAGGG